MCANVRGTSTMFGDWKQIVSESHRFFPVRSAEEDILPCIHVLCSTCLDMIQRRTGKRSGDKIVCRVCKLDFEIPSSKVLRERKYTTELLSELSIAANNITQWCEICRNEYPFTWNETSGKSALVYCPLCRKNECRECADTRCRGHRPLPKRSHFTEKPTNRDIHERHKKRLEIYCIGCNKDDCLLCLLGNVPSSNRGDIDEALSIDTELQSLDTLSKQLSTSKAQVKEQIKDFQASVMMVKNKIEASYRDQISAIENQRKSLLNQLRAINTEVKEQLEKNRDIIDELSKKADICRKSFASMQSTSKAEEKFYAAGAALKKIDELKTELISSLKLRCPTISFESTDKYFETSELEVHWTDERSGDEGIIVAEKSTSKDVTEAETDGYQVPSSTKGHSRERSENVSATFSLHIKQDPKYENREDRENSFSEALAKYNEMLKKMREKLFLDNYRRTTTYQRTSVLRKNDAEDLLQQFDQVRSIRSDKRDTTQWKNIERCHEQLVSLANREIEGDCFKKIMDEIEDMLKQTTAAMDKKEDDTRAETSGSLYKSGPPQSGPHSMRENRYQEGLENFGNTCYFNAVIQCLCQTSSLLTDLSRRNMSDQPLTLAFVQFWNHRSVDSADQNEAFSEFFQQLFTSSPKFNNFSQHDSHDLFIHFLNDLRSEERRSNVDPKKVLTTVDKVFGGHFITMYACLNCTQPYFVCECLLDISLPICRPIHKQQYYSGGGSGIASQESRQRQRDATVGLHTDQNTASYSGHDNKLKRGFLEALNEEQNMPTNQGGGYRATPVTLTECLQFYTETEDIPEGYLCLSCQDVNQSAATVSAQSMPPALKRTLIYNPPAILVLHMKRFERTATGFTKRSDRVVYEELLDLGPYCSSDCRRIYPEDKNVWYSLYGVVVHIGTLQCGHYIAYVKIRDSNATAMKTFLQEEFLDREQVAIEQNIKNRGSKRVNRKVEWQPERETGGRWIHVSDSYARAVTAHEALNQEAFMLFYERVPKHGHMSQ